MSAPRATALIADDEPILRGALARMLAEAWPELEIVAEARNGREAIERFEELKPDICFLDVHMPGVSGIEAAQRIGRRARLVFVTAYNQYAVQAFEHEALDYLVKPLDAARLADTIARLKAYSEAGADCLYAPGIRTREEIAAVVKAAAPKPVNVLVGSTSEFTVADLAALGVRRISVGGALARAAWGGFLRAARGLAEEGRFDGFAGATPGKELNGIFRGGD